MTRLAVLLRGVNVGGHRRVPMAAWRARLEDLGCTEVTTHLQSGQAVVASGLSPDALATAVRADLLEGLGVETDVLVRDHAQLRAVVDGCPWPEAADEAPTTVHVAFLDSVPGPGVLYLLMPGGAGRTRMPAKGPGTARNWRTVVRLLEMTGA